MGDFKKSRLIGACIVRRRGSLPVASTCSTRRFIERTSFCTLMNWLACYGFARSGDGAGLTGGGWVISFLVGAGATL
jgi:hypothetical protein